MKKVLLIDSGSGGVNILKECVKVVPKCDFLLFCDDKNLPYGNKTKEELIEITIQNLKNIYQFFKFEIVVLACNTLSCTCLEECRKRFEGIIFVGTVPAVKSALEKYQEKDVLVLATETTIKHNVLINGHKTLILKEMPFLASEIDANLDNLSVLESQIENALKNIQVRAVVLGCTHYKSVEGIVVKVLGGKVEVFDSANGVARRLKSFVRGGEENCQVQIMLSGNQAFLPVLWNYYLQK